MCPTPTGQTLEAHTPAERMAVAFARVLRGAGLRVPMGSVITFVDALGRLRLDQRDDVYWAGRATLVRNPEDVPLYDRSFEVFWQAVTGEPEPAAAEPIHITLAVDDDSDEGDDGAGSAEPNDDPQLTLRFSAMEVLRHKDFEQMSAGEAAEARRVIAARRWSLPERQSRRLKPSAGNGRPDIRRTLRKALRSGGHVREILRRKPRTIEAPLVILCDISGSMSMYARMCLHMFHGLMADRRIRRARTHTFVFGTRLTNITHALSCRDPDVALAEVSRIAEDWDGGTRIGEALHRFNFEWARRVLGQGATVLLVTDGLEREGLDLLEAEASRLGRTARRVIWLNPLLRYDAFAPKAGGIRVLLRHVHELRTVHNLASLMDLAGALQARDGGDELARIRKRMA